MFKNLWPKRISKTHKHFINNPGRGLKTYLLFNNSFEYSAIKSPKWSHSFLHGNPTNLLYLLRWKTPRGQRWCCVLIFPHFALTRSSFDDERPLPLLYRTTDVVLKRCWFLSLHHDDSIIAAEEPRLMTTILDMPRPLPLCFIKLKQFSAI